MAKKNVRVKTYKRKDGTVVKSHLRSVEKKYIVKSIEKKKKIIIHALFEDEEDGSEYETVEEVDMTKEVFDKYVNRVGQSGWGGGLTTNFDYNWDQGYIIYDEE